MHINELFTVPEGEKITEKVFGRVLISSFFSILLCIVCLVGTTWAWFTVSIENEGNEIQIATVTANVNIQDEAENVVNEAASGNYNLAAGTYTIHIKLDNNATEWKRAVYVVMSVVCNHEQKYYYFTFENANREITQTLSIGGVPATIGFSVSWIKPASGESVGGEAIVIGEIPTEPSTQWMEATTAPTTPHEATTVPKATELTPTF